MPSPENWRVDAQWKPTNSIFVKHFNWQWRRFCPPQLYFVVSFLRRLPADFFAHVRAGDFFGWPYAYNGAHPDPVFGAKRPDLVIKSKVPDVLIEAHSAPLGLLFYTGKQFPSEYQGDAFIALHGSGPYDKPDAYKVIRIRFKNGEPIGGYEDFVTGFSRIEHGNLKVWGTPSQMAVASDGSILLVDDKGACVWRIAYVGK